MSKHAKAGKRRSTIGIDPLDAVVPNVAAASRASRRGLAPAATTPPPAPRRGRVEKARATFHLPVALLDELKDAVVFLSGPPDRLTLARVAEDALREKLEELKRTKNKGRAFPKREAELVGGRPIGS